MRPAFQLLERAFPKCFLLAKGPDSWDTSLCFSLWLRDHSASDKRIRQPEQFKDSSEGSLAAVGDLESCLGGAIGAGLQVVLGRPMERCSARLRQKQASAGPETTLCNLISPSDLGANPGADGGACGSLFRRARAG